MTRDLDTGAMPVADATRRLALAQGDLPAPDVHVTDLPFDLVTGLVTRGIYRGLDVARARAMEHGYLSETYALVTFRVVTLRPWWRAFRRTPAMRLAASHPHVAADVQ